MYEYTMMSAGNVLSSCAAACTSPADLVLKGSRSLSVLQAAAAAGWATRACTSLA